MAPGFYMSKESEISRDVDPNYNSDGSAGEQAKHVGSGVNGRGLVTKKNEGSTKPVEESQVSEEATSDFAQPADQSIQQEIASNEEPNHDTSKKVEDSQEAGKSGPVQPQEITHSRIEDEAEEQVSEAAGQEAASQQGEANETQTEHTEQSEQIAQVDTDTRKAEDPTEEVAVSEEAPSEQVSQGQAQDEAEEQVSEAAGQEAPMKRRPSTRNSLNK